MAYLAHKVKLNLSLLGIFAFEAARKVKQQFRAKLHINQMEA